MSNTPVLLSSYIETNHEGNIQAFATDHNTNRQSVYNWIRQGAFYWHGDVMVGKNLIRKES